MNAFKALVMGALLASGIASTAMAADGPPTEASIRTLLSVMEARKLLDGSAERVDSMVQAGMLQGLNGATPTAEQLVVLDDVRRETVALTVAALKWEKMEPMLIQVYGKSFSQSEVDGMLTFYRSPAGIAVIKKMPTVMNYTMQEMQTMMAGLMPQLQAVQQKGVERLRALKSPTPAPAKP